MIEINKEIIEGLKRANFVYIIGNGGSASTANHFANDLVKLCGIKAISLCANEAIIMAYANDDGYENVFSEQLKVFLTSKDLLVTISGSGTSPNIVKAHKYATQIGCDVWRFPTMSELNFDMQEIENRHIEIVHRYAKELAKK